MSQMAFPAIDPVATGLNILRLRKEKGLSVRDLQNWFHFEEPRAIYKWQRGQTLPNLDNLYALSVLFQVPIDSIIVGTCNTRFAPAEPQAAACGSARFGNEKRRRTDRPAPVWWYFCPCSRVA